MVIIRTARILLASYSRLLYGKKLSVRARKRGLTEKGFLRVSPALMFLEAAGWTNGVWTETEELRSV